MEAGLGAISLCLIAKDEEKNLARCLKSVHGYVDEIIVIDTGSRDATPDIAASYGATVIHSPWRKDFSRARNESLRYATRDWVLILDADEELPAETARSLGKLASAPGVEAWTFTIVSPVASAQDSPRTRHLNLRLFRNRESYRFEGRIHEQIKPSILRANPGAVIRYSELTIMHYGYEREGRADKTRRNVAILKEALAESPADPFINYHLGVSCYALGDLDSARRHYEAAFQRLDLRSGLAPALYRNYGLCLHDMGEYVKALEWADKGLAHFPDYPDLYFLKGQVFWDLGMLPQARASFIQCTRFRRVPPEYTTTEGVTGYLAYENLAEVYARLGDFKQAVDCLTRAVTEKTSRRLLSRLCDFLRGDGRTGREIAAYLREHSDLCFPDMARLLFEAREYEACLNHIGRGDSVTDPGIMAVKAKCLLRLGRYAEAVDAARAIPPGSVFAEEGLGLECVAAWLQVPREDASAAVVRFGRPGSPMSVACRAVNTLVVGGGAEGFEGLDEKARSLSLDLAVEILGLGDRDLALAVARAASGPEPGEAYFALGKLALERGLIPEAKSLLERALNRCAANAEAYYLLGTACAHLTLHDRAFRYCLEAARLAPEKELYAACALEQLVRRCRLFVVSGLQLDSGDVALRRELFRLVSLEKKLSHAKEGARHG